MYIYIYTLSLYLYIYYVILYYIPYIPSIHVCFAWKLWRQWKYHNSQYSFSNRIDRMEATWCVPFFTGFALPPARPLSACSCFLISVFLNTSYPVRLSTYSKSERIFVGTPLGLWSQSLTKDGKYHMKNTTLWCFGETIVSQIASSSRVSPSRMGKVITSTKLLKLTPSKPQLWLVITDTTSWHRRHRLQPQATAIGCWDIHFWFPSIRLGLVARIQWLISRINPRLITGITSITNFITWNSHFRMDLPAGKHTKNELENHHADY